MRVGIFHSRKLVYFSLACFFILILNGAYLDGVVPAAQKADQVFQQGVELYNEGEYVKAISKLSRVLILTESQPLLTDSYFYLSLCNYYLENHNIAKAWIKKLLELDPQREATALYPEEYIALFNQAKREAASELMERERMRRRPAPPPAVQAVPPPAREPANPPAVVYQQAPRRRGGGKFLLYALGGALVAGAALYFFVFKEEKETTGGIQINSNPPGAQVFLDAVDTGNVSNCTLSDIAPGSHVVRLVKEGYMEFEQSVSVTAGETAMVSGNLMMHTLTVTQPASGVTWGTGQQVTIRWESNAGSGSYGGAIAKNRGVLSTVNPSGQIARMNRLRMFRRSPSQRSIDQQVRTLRSREEQTVKYEAKADTGTAETSGSSLNNPRSRHLNTLHFPGANLSGPNNIQPMVLSNVKIELYKGGSALRTIVGSTPNDGSHNWTVASDLALGSNYKVRISCPGDAAVYAESDNFTIAKVGSLKVDSTPQTASVFIDGVDTGKKTNYLFKNVAVGNRVVKVVKEGYGDQQKTVTIKSGERTTVAFTLKEMNLEVIQPNSVSVWDFGEDVTIRWTTTAVTDPGKPNAGKQDVTTVKIELYKGASRVRTIVSSTENDGIYSWTVSSTLVDGANYKVMVSAAQKPSVFDYSDLFCITQENYVLDTTWGEYGSASSQFNYPRAIALGRYGRIYVADTGNHRIQKFGQTGNYVTQWGSLGSGNGQLNSPWGVCGDPNSGYIYVADTYNHRVQKFSNTGTYIRKWGSNGSANGQFRYPAGIAVDQSGYVYVVDNNNHRVQKFTSAGVFVSSWSGYQYPFGAAFGPLDNYLYVVDKNNQRIRVTTPWGSFVEQWGTMGSGDGQFNYPYDIAFDKAGFSYVVEWGNDRIQKFTPRKRFVSKWGQLGSGYGEFNNPQGVEVDSLGNVYVLDSQNHRIQKFK